MLAFATYNNIKLFQMNVKSALLNGSIKEEVYVEQPPGFESVNFPQHVYKLNKALYDLKQAPRAWYERLSSFILENGFQRGKVDNTLFCKDYSNEFIMVKMYVDDIIFGATNEILCKDFSSLMQEEFEMSMMGELNFFFWTSIKHTKDKTFIHQSKYVRELLKRFNLYEAKPMSTPMYHTTSLGLDKESSLVNITQYRQMIRSLLYLTTSRLDIMLSECLCARFQAGPREVHLSAIKRIFIYLKGTANLGLCYKRRETLNCRDIVMQITQETR